MAGRPPNKDSVNRDEQPQEAGSKVKERYALYRTGMTVAEYVEACKNTRSPQYALNDINWDSRAGFIELVSP